jgi:starch-binding outer membrane protein, SusD/RagB family
MKKCFKISMIALVLFATGCSKTYLNEDPQNILAPENLYTSKAGFESGLYGLYNMVRQERGGISSSDANNTPTFGVMMIGVDNAYGNFTDYLERNYNEWGIRNNPLDAYNRQLCEFLYQIVNASNTLIGRAENTAIQWSAADKSQIVAEARLIRAWAYRHISFLWGDMPLVLKESSGSTIKTDWERTSVAEIRTQIENDLLFAEQNLADNPPTEGRFPKAVATHYLAELYLTIGNNAMAKEKTLAIINSGLYKLITARYGVKKNQPGTPFTDMFIDGNSNRSEGNTEALWVMQNAYLNNGGDNNIMRRWWVNRYDAIAIGGKTPIAISVDNGGRGLGRFAVTKYGLSVYTPSDHRGGQYAWRLFWLMNNPSSLPTGSAIGDIVTINTNGLETLGNARWPNTRKWDWAPTDNVLQASNYNDQIYLQLAEAQLKLGELEEAAATLNTLRTRANAAPIKASDVTLNFILDERSRELFSEEHRRYTLLRTKTWFTRTQQYNMIAGANIQLRDTVLPVPQSVIDANLTKPMPQNPGY